MTSSQRSALRVGGARGMSAPSGRRHCREGNRIGKEHGTMSRRFLAFAGVFSPVVAVLAVVSMGQVTTSAQPSFGDPLPGLTADELDRFLDGKADFEEAEEADEGLGPVFNE